LRRIFFNVVYDEFEEEKLNELIEAIKVKKLALPQR
jgi:hypothetical protein